MTGAIIGSTVIGGITSYNNSRAIKQAGKEQRELQTQALHNQEANNRFNADRYMDSYLDYLKMEDIYGSLQEDVSTYYKNLNGSTLGNREILQLKERAQKVNDDIVKQMSMRGMGDSGLSEFLINSNNFNTEKGIATINATAEDRAMEMKAGYLGQITNQRNNLYNQGNAAAASISNGVNAENNLLLSKGNSVINQTNATNSINNSFANQLQTSLGYSSRREEAYASDYGQNEGMY